MDLIRRCCLVARVLVVGMVILLFPGGSTAAATYPIKVSSANPRVLVDQNNAPFLLVGDSPHSLIVNLTVADAERFMYDRNTNGFNSLWIELLCEDSEAGRPDGSLLDGTQPFTNTLGGGLWDLTTPNEAYFAHVDTIVRLAATNGLQLLFNPLDTGGWTDTALTNGSARCRQYGQFLGNRYKDFPNIIWLHGNDFQTWRTASNNAAVSAIALGIKDTDTNHLQTVQLDFPVSGSLDSTNWAAIVNVDSAYTYYATYARVLQEYQRTNRMPVVMIEAHYEYQTNYYGDFGTAPVLRRQAYWTMLSGAIGHCYGNSAVWRFKPGWDAPAIFNSVGVTELKHSTALFQSRRWQAFEPDINHTVLTAGFGTFSTNSAVSSNNYATCARETNGHTVMIYAPTQRAMTVNLTKVSGTNALAWWFDPRSGTATNFGLYATTNSQVFTPPDTNDWVLVLDDASQNFAAPGSAPLVTPLLITTESLSNALTGVSYSAQLTAAGGTAPYSWNLDVTNALLPDGLSLNPNGTLTGAAISNGIFDFGVVVTDAEGVFAKTNLQITVSVPPPGTLSFTNASVITIPDFGPATPYPATINVSGLGGVVARVKVDLLGLNHTWPSDLEILLVSPTGEKTIVISDAGKDFSSGTVNLRLSDAAPEHLPESAPLTSGTFKPTDYPPDDGFPSPAPAGPYGTNLSVFAGQPANGTWSLYVHDDMAGNEGAISEGWALSITTVEVPLLSIASAGENAVLLSWPAPPSLFTVQENIDLFGNNWAEVTNFPVVANDHYELSLPATNAAAFYRLTGSATNETIPPLAIAGSTDGIVLSWPAPIPDFLLEQNDDLATTNWIATTNYPAVAAGTNLLTLQATNGKSFYRLKLR